MLNIRRISQQAIQARIWQQRYQPDLGVITPKQGSRYFQLELVSANEKVQALVDVEAWCEHHWPSLTHYAWSSLDNANLASLFHSEYRETLFFSEHFRCGSFEIIDYGCTKQDWFCVQEPLLGYVLLSVPIEGLVEKPPQQTLLNELKLQADWVLGVSYISIGLLQSIALHDVFCIQHLQLCLSISGRFIARFQKQQEGQFMIEEMIDLQSEDSEQTQVEDFTQEIIQPFDINGMSVKLTFVLGHSEIAINELANIQPGTVYSIGENKEREVKVYANKQLIAEGELIYIGDSDELGLEITRLASLGNKGL
ncbi:MULTISPECIES: FliM/FliN family flagellar motor switch protein [Providencia]|uniref:FliM/FliN family flagellar motor switch protein n=1 Tax=Providencia TaxID=586 RepID=UPI00112042CF|nr:FliM/FliN family flagellar motor switch protein [Providencia stuartii]